MKLTIWGAARQVTGSMHLLELEDYKILIDCGLDYEKDTYQEENQHFPFDPGSIDVVILTHAHIDHSGNLPTLIRMGFEGQILCTPATADLTELLLLDSVNIFISKQSKASKGRRKRGPGPQPLYLHKHVMDTVDRFVTINFHKTFRINNEVALEFIPIGHLLGAAAVVLTLQDQGITKKIAFTGDIGRSNYPVLGDPEPIPQVDYLVSESTYGGRLHSSEMTLEQKLISTIQESCIKNPGRLIIPAFSIGRTQSLVFALNQIFSKGLLPYVKIFVDSPLAESATAIYRKHYQLLNQEAQDFYTHQGDQFEFEGLSYVHDKRESVSISNYHEPCIIISSAGMLEGGRIQDHLYYNIQNYYCTILFIGYCSKGTLGHRLLRGDSIVRLRNRDLMVYASIQKTDLLSGHGDHKDLVNTVKQQDPTKLKQVFLVHGEDKSSQSLAEALREIDYKVSIPELGEVFDL
ncbi:MBL fold metallo-hydrolase RNA specificity domain-containing protein [Pedobacter gandavensis]|uniref:MBL fold metallo-hydrolase n=1 Tax=Pedobacter gandavensis TaxID=2679963 RepID=A0ABR6ETA3_9SPHI|nr:MBL fold metallo-hydrolase [Pedobacter gandavensis]MBB2148432.1 MBL fold metallo-hydrolase [Pedobacter gandavensis]